MKPQALVATALALALTAGAAAQATARSKSTDWFATAVNFTNVGTTYSWPWEADYKHWIGTEPGFYTPHRTASYPRWPGGPNDPGWANVPLNIPPVTTTHDAHFIGKCISYSTWDLRYVQRGAQTGWAPGVSGYIDADADAGWFSNHDCGSKTRFTDPWAFDLPANEEGILTFWTEFDVASYLSAPAPTLIDASGYARIQRNFIGEVISNTGTTTIDLLSASVGSSQSLFELGIGEGVSFLDGGTVPDKLNTLLAGLHITDTTASWQLSGLLDLSCEWRIAPAPYDRTVKITWSDITTAVAQTVPSPGSIAFMTLGLCVALRRRR